MTPAVYRAPMRSRDDAVDPGLAVVRALDHGLCGIGGVLPRRPASLEEALSWTDERYGARPARRLERFAAVEDGSLVWTRDPEGLYFLGRLAGPWRYDDAQDAVTADLVHVRSCRWVPEPVAEADVPAATRQTFARGGRNFQQTHHPDVGRESLELWEQRGSS
jgi:hypothetical protein